MASKKLNEMHRNAFVNGILKDTPSVDYSAEAQKLVTEYCEANMNPKVKAVYDDPKLQELLGTNHFSLYGTGLASFNVRGFDRGLFEKVKITLDKKIQALKVKNDAQKAERAELTTRLRELILSVSTVAQATKAFPEFAKYLLADTPALDKNVPMLIAEDTLKLLKKSGWPNGVERP
jgi:hypothetical protein